MHTGIGLNLSAAERHMSELHAIEREIEAHVAATERALADTPKMSDLEVARRIAVSHVPLWAINLCAFPTLTFENVCLRQNCAPMCDFAAPPPAPSVLPASSVPSRVVWTKAHTW